MLRLRAIQIGARNGLRPAVTNQFFPAACKFVALGMPAKIVMVVQNQNACALSCQLPEEISRRQTADSATYNDQVVIFFLFFCMRPFLAVAEGMSRFPRAVVA